MKTDGLSGYLTLNYLSSKDASTVNPLMKAYVRWVERSARRSVQKIVASTWMLREGMTHLQVHAILTDKGGVFINGDIFSW